MPKDSAYMKAYRKRGGGGGGGKLGKDAQEYSGYSKDYRDMADQRDRSAGASVDHAMNLAAGKWETTRLEEFYSSDAARQTFEGMKFRAQADAIDAAIRKNPKITRDELGRVEFNAAQEFARSTQQVPKRFTGRSTTDRPRNADMREYFDSHGGLINTNARDGGYGDIKRSWGKAFADKWRKKRDNW